MIQYSHGHTKLHLGNDTIRKSRGGYVVWHQWSHICPKSGFITPTAASVFLKKVALCRFSDIFLWSTFDKVLAFGAKKSTLVLGFRIAIFIFTTAKFLNLPKPLEFGKL